MKKAMGIMNRVISLALGFVMCVSLFPIAGIDDYAFASEDDYIEIYDIEDLYAINNNMSGNYRLMQDIDMTEATAEGGDWDYMGNGWNPIGSGGNYGATDFSGTFDGNGHTIKGMRIDITDWPSGTETVNVGLFSSVSGTIKNISFRDCYIGASYKGKIRFTGNVGIVCGILNSSSIIYNVNCVSCISNCSINIIGYYNGGSYFIDVADVNMGGICGYSNGSTISNCSVDNYISSDITAHSFSKIFIGGICGYGIQTGIFKCNTINSCNSSFTTDSGASGSLYDSEEDYYVGGICAKGDIVEECFNLGNVASSIKGKDHLGSIITNYVGGIAGTASSIRNCYNIGDITYNYSTTVYYYAIIGGIVGNGGTEDCYNRGFIQGTKNSYCKGRKTCGINVEGGTTDCYYLTGTGDSTAGAQALTDAQMKTSTCFSGFDFDTIWTIDQATAYVYPQLKENRQDVNKIVAEISISEYPDKISYYTEETVDVTGGILCVYYIDGTFELIPMTSDMVTDEPFTQTGPQSVIVTYGGATCSFDVNVSAMPNVTSMVLISPPNKTEFVKDTYFDFSGCRVRINFDNGTTREIEIDASMTTGGDIHTLGTQTIKYEYKGYSVEFEIRVIGLRIESIEITSLPNKLEYIEGQDLDTTGLVVMAHYNNGDTKEVLDYSISGYSSEVGIHAVIIEYMNHSASFEVTVVKKTVLSLTVVSTPYKTEYFQGEPLDPDGLVVKAIYDNGDEEIVADYIIGPMPVELGIQRVEISFGGISTYIVVKIIQKELVSISIESLPDKITYAEDEVFKVDGLAVCANYSDGSSVPIEDYTLSGIDTSTIGEKEATVFYNGKTATFTYTVIAKVLEYISVTEPEKTIYIEGEEFDPTGMIVTAYYSNGKYYEVENYTVDGYTGAPGTNVITVTYGDQSFSFPVNVYTPASEWTILLAPTCTEPGTKALYDISGTVVLKVETIEALGHTIVEDAGHPATCLEDGLTDGSHCSACGLVFVEQEVIPATGHTPASEWTTVLEPTCTENGTQVKYCVTCGEIVETQPKSAVGHRPVIDEEVPATCTSSGTTSGTHCEVCGLVLTAPTVIPPLGHAWSSGTVTTQPTCTTPGIKTFTCLRCSEQKTETILALDHDFEEEWTIDKEPTCTEDGSKSHHCTRCDAVNDVTVIRHLGHSFTTYVSNNDATCTEDGTKTSKCDRCEETSTITDVGSAKGHTVVTDPAVPANCTDTGLTEGSHCSVCGVVLVAQTVVPAIGHSLKHVEAVSATCETEGNVEYWSCGTCGHYYSNSDASTEITIADTVIPATGHVHITGTESKAPSCETVGNIAYWTCEDCGKIFSDAEATTVITLADTVIPATGHVHLTATEAVSPTCETAGNTAYWTCEDCGKIFSDATATAVIALADTVIPATGHVHLTATAAQAPTCSAAGNIAYWTCDACGKYFADAEGTTMITAEDTVIPINPEAHAWGDWVVTTAAGCETEGEETRVCTYDNSHFETRPVPALGHDWDEGVVIKEPTYWEEGLKLYTCRHDPTHTYTEVIPMLEKPSENEMIRIYGPNRSATAIEAANHLKEKNGIDKFDSIIIASGTGFPDALSASYLAYKKDGPILLVDNSSISTVSDYVNENLAENGTVYIVGGKGAVPLTVDENIIAFHGDEAILRLAGSDRYATNILVLNEAGVDGEDMLIASGTGFADALSASAAKRPILLVGASLSSDQIKYLSDNAGKLTGKYYVIGGKAAVSLEIENAIGGYGTVKRLSGSNRYATSIAVADEFFPGNVSTVVIANGMNFPDGLSGGPIAAAYDAPLVLLVDNTADHAKKLFKDKGAFRLIIMGGKGVISDGTAEMIAYQ